MLIYFLLVCEGGSLAELLEDHRRTGTHFSETELSQIVYQLAQGLRYIHSQNLVHLDIKPGKYCPTFLIACYYT